MYTNPIIPGFNPDPSIVRVNSDYFLVTSSFEYVPGAPIYHSTDLIQWTLIGHALTRPSQLQIQTPEPGGGVWATTLRYHEGFFYCLAACFQRYRPQEDDRVWPRGFYVKTANIWDSDSWSDPVYFDQVGFDQDVSVCVSLNSGRGSCCTALLGRRWHHLPVIDLPQTGSHPPRQFERLRRAHRAGRPGDGRLLG